MADPVPVGAYAEAAKSEQAMAVNVLGTKKPAFDTRSKSLVAMRIAVNEHESRLDKIEEALLRRPF